MGPGIVQAQLEVGRSCVVNRTVEYLDCSLVLQASFREPHTISKSNPAIL